MNTSPDTTLAAPGTAEELVYSPIPVLRSRPAGQLTYGGVDPAPAAAGYAAGWAQGVAAAAVNERQALAQVAAAATAAREELAAHARRALVALDAAAEAMRQRTAPDVDATADALAAAAIDLAEVVLGGQLAEGDAAERARLALTRALAGLPEHQQVVVRLHPADFAVLREAMDSTDAPVDSAGSPDPLAGRRGVQLDADPRLAPGDAVADFPGGSVDARVASALGRMRSALRAGDRS